MGRSRVAQGMPGLSRREALRTLGSVGSLLLAGCAGEASRSESVPHPGEPVANPEVRFARDPDGEPIFEPADESGEDTPDRQRRPAVVEFLAAPVDREQVVFRETEAGASLRSFVDDTDFESEAVYLLEQAIGECYTLALERLVRDDDGGVSADFCQRLRPADVGCSADANDTVGVAVRLAFEGDDVGSLGTGIGRCGHRPVIAAEGRATE